MGGRIGLSGRSAIITLMLVTILLISCPNPLTQVMVVNVKDHMAPVIVVTSPTEGSLCANIVEIVGKVTDTATESGDDGLVRSLSYTVPGSTVAGSIAFGSDGTFSFQFSTVTLGTNFIVAIAAVDWNGNTGTASLPLQKQAGNGIPSLAVDPGNKHVTVTWGPVPHTMSYTLYYTTNGALPSEQVGMKKEHVASPYVLSSLANGDLLVVQLRAIPEAGWPESISNYLTTIPLCPQTLAPRVAGEFRQIRIDWPSISATSTFEVWRAMEQNGTYYNLSGSIESTSYVDTSVSSGTWYWYKVRPTLLGSTMSFSNGGQTDPFGLPNPAIVSTFRSTNAYGVAISGFYAYVADGPSGLRVIDISNPLSPVLKGTCPTTNALGVVVSGSYAYVADSQSGLRVIDISNPLSPALKATCSTTNALGVAVSGSFAYVADYTSGLRVIDISNPLSPAFKGTCSTTKASGVTVSGSYAYVADGS